MDPTPFFNYAREREAIRVRRSEGKPRPWTDDPILDTYRFCNVYREDDATTIWFRKWVRDLYDNSPEVLLATVLFRWFNRTTTGDAIFRQLGDYTPNGQGSIRTAFGQFLVDGRTDSLKHAVLRHCGKGPYVTGAYIIKTPDGMNKLDGVLWCIDQFNKSSTLGRSLAELLEKTRGETTLEKAWDWLRRAQYLGDFMAYEIVTDLRHTYLLSGAPDIYTWANPGPGAMRGLNRLYGRELNKKQDKYLYICEMRQLLHNANTEFRYIWPRQGDNSPEMRDIEHTLCEFDKYERARLGQGRPRGTYS